MATLKLYHGGGIFAEIENYSVTTTLLFDVVAQTPPAELTAFEKLNIVHSVGVEVHPSYLADVHMACGCFAEARKHYEQPEHPRKLGDICWCEGLLDEAERRYLQVKSEAQFYRTGPDYDRLIKLAFFRDQSDAVIGYFCSANFGKGILEGQVSIGSGSTAAAPYAQMLACSVNQLGIETPAEALAALENAFGISASNWAEMLQSDAAVSTKTVEKLKKRCRPRIGAALATTEAEACRKGDTARARAVASYIRSADENLAPAQSALESFGVSGNAADLDRFMAYVTSSGVDSISRSFLFSALGHDSFTTSNAPADRLIRLLTCHPIMHRRHFGQALDLRFKNSVPLNGEDILTGIFQSIGGLVARSTRKPNSLADVVGLASCREWARMRLDEWIAGKAKARVDGVASVWRDGTATAAPDRFSPTLRPVLKSPRDTKEWNDFMAEALTWLRARYSREIGATPWIAENQLFQLLRRQLKGTEVVQHARPTWLDPQHLDVYVPSADVAIEYMGRQHFEPLEFFGGVPAFEALVERDRRKEVLCREHGIKLIHVRFDEDLGVRSKQIIEEIRSNGCLNRR